MKKLALGLLSTILTAGGMFLVSSCSNVVDDCREIGRCKPSGAGGTSSKTSPNGGVSPIGGASSSTAGTGALCCTAAGGSATSETASTTCNVTCTGEKPICDTTTGECVACTSDAHCSGQTPGCDLTTNTCVACSSDANCSGATPVCDTALHQCVGCTSNASCTIVPLNTCDTSVTTCVECLATGDCRNATKPVCKAEAKTCVECMVNTDCSNKTILQGTAGAPGAAGASGRAGAAGAGGTAGAPNSPASTPNLVCDTTINACVGCLGNSDCEGTPSTPICDTANRTCVACLSNTDCKSAAASRCDLTAGSLTANTCLPCTSSTDCTQVDGKHLCFSEPTQPNRCVACTVANESACNGNSCNPKTNTCTTTPKSSVDLCGACVADSECTRGPSGTILARCIPMTFGPSATPHGSYCLEAISSGCDRPFGDSSGMKITKASASGAPIDDYCGINQELVTCEAILDMKDVSDTIRCTNTATTQPDDALCGCPRDADGKCTKSGEGGLCRTIGSQNRCTIQCGGGSECRTTYTCTTDSTSYCG